MYRVLMLMLCVSSTIGSVAKAAEPAKPAPEVTSAALEGDWVLLPHKATLGTTSKMVTWVDASSFERFKPLGVKELADLSYLRFEKGKLRLLSDLDKKEARVAVRVESPGERVREPGFCRIVFKVDGKELAGICRVEGDKLEIRVPESCVCAKTGELAVYQRVGK